MVGVFANGSIASPIQGEGSLDDVSAAPGGYTFVCYDYRDDQTCRGAPYYYTCTKDGHLNYEVRLNICHDVSKCDCELPCLNPRIC
jgi:hypothetical protein